MKKFILKNSKGEAVANGANTMTTDMGDALAFDERDNMVIKVRWFTMHMRQPVKPVEVGA